MTREFEIEVGPVEALSETEARCVLSVRVPADLRYVEGHFENAPIVPGIAQLLPLIYEPACDIWPDLGPVGEIRRLKFRGAIHPGHELEVELTRTPDRLRFVVRNQDEKVTTGSFVLSAASE